MLVAIVVNSFYEGINRFSVSLQKRSPKKDEYDQVPYVPTDYLEMRNMIL